MIATLFVVFAFASSALGALPTQNLCPVPPTTPGADIDKIAGLWHVISPPTSDPPSTFYFMPRKDGNFNVTIPEDLRYGEKVYLNLLGERSDNENLLNIYPDMSKKYPYLMSLNILDVDYIHYMAGYMCFYLPTRSFPIGPLVLSRSNTMSADKLAELTDLIKNYLETALVQ
ncbi:uncharacterized protein LOC107361023 [Tetranychus urticae]|uniref:Lipocalin/cytosolic fatty-acid binding domain-containing protein n=1 Tax=Tetranychus urticae TaxID=32264 RepID=T1K760_TETUR|nr:uncharacterized protein LOC107361023 [Tetranychus urticae]